MASMLVHRLSACRPSGSTAGRNHGGRHADELAGTGRRGMGAASLASRIDEPRFWYSLFGWQIPGRLTSSGTFHDRKSLGSVYTLQRKR